MPPSLHVQEALKHGDRTKIIQASKVAHTDIASFPDPTHVCARVQILGPLQNLKASNEIAKWRLLEYCGSERIYILPCESSSFTILWLSLCLVLSGPFATAGSSYIYIHVSSHRWAIYFWKQDSQSRRRTSKHRWRACRSSTLYSVSASNLSNRWYSEYNFS